MTNSELAAIRERAERAAPGPWKAVRTEVFDNESEGICVPYGISEFDSKNMKFIAHSRADIPALLSHISSLEAKLEKAREALKEIAGPGWRIAPIIAVRALEEMGEKVPCDSDGDL